MKNVYEVLRQKELELSRLEKEVEALRVVAPLLSEEAKETMGDGPKPTLTAAPPIQQPIRLPHPWSVWLHNRHGPQGGRIRRRSVGRKLGFRRRLLRGRRDCGGSGAIPGLLVLRPSREWGSRRGLPRVERPFGARKSGAILRAPSLNECHSLASILRRDQRIRGVGRLGLRARIRFWGRRPRAKQPAEKSPSATPQGSSRYPRNDQLSGVFD